jgi:hypothetical protein
VLEADQPSNDEPSNDESHAQDSLHMPLNQGMLMQRVVLSKIGSCFTLLPTFSAAWQRTCIAMGMEFIRRTV